MADLRADQRRFLFLSNAGEFDVLSFEGEESICAPYRFDIKLIQTEDRIDPADLVRKRGRLSLLTADGEQRHINGIVGRASLQESGMTHSIYTVQLVPYFKLLAFRIQSRIFQNKTIQDILSKVLQDAGMAGSDFQIILNGAPPVLKYCVQYRESDLAFIDRLTAAAGIYYFFRQEADREILVFGDDHTVHPKCEPQSKVLFHFQTGNLNRQQDVLNRCSLDAQVFSGRVVLGDYNPERPDTQLQSMSASQKFQSLEAFNHPGGFGTLGEGEIISRHWKNAKAVYGKSITGSGSYRCLTVGHTVSIENHINPDIDGLYTVLKVSHEGNQPQVAPQIQSEKHDMVYEGCFTGIPAEVPFKPLVIDKPLATIQSAEVVGPDGEQVYMDDMGRVKVKFHWDRECSDRQDCTCWIRVSDGYAGGGHGIHFPPLIGDEVLVDFIHGDPDRPIITGRVYNGRNLPPVKPDQVVRNLMYTEYGHRFLLDDKNGLISLTTGGDEKILMTDKAEKDGNMIRLETKDGHVIDLAQGDNLKGIQLVSKKEQTILMEDEPAPGITLKDMNQELSIRLDSKSQTISIKNQTSKSINVECEDGTIKLSAKRIKVSGSGGVDIDSGSHIALSAPKIDVKGHQSVKVKAGQALNLESDMNTTLKGGMKANITGGAMTIVKGGIVKIN